MGFFRRLFGRDDGDAADESQRGISKEEALGAYIVREHKLGRDISEILEDHVPKNARATSSACGCSSAPR